MASRAETSPSLKMLPKLISWRQRVTATGIFNIGSAIRVTINDLAQLIIKLAGNSNIQPVYSDTRPGDIMQSLADITKAKALGFLPRYSLEEGLKEVISYMRR